VHRDRIYPGERLVEQHELGLGDERAGDLEATPLTPGKLEPLLPPQMLDRQLVEQSLQPLAPLGVPQRQGLEDRPDVVLHGELAEHRRLLGQVADAHPCPTVHRLRRDVPSVERDVPAVGPYQAGDHVERRGLPRPVGAEQADDLALIELHAHIVHDRTTLVGLEHPVVRGGSRLTATGLLKAYKGRSVVNDVSVQLDQGEIVGLLGPNGAGKTTTFYMITGLIRPDGGHIALDGRDITAEPMYRRARMGIGYLAQEPSVFRKLTVEDNVRAILETLPLGD